MNLKDHSDEQIIEQITRARSDERRSLTRVLRLLDEVDRHMLYAELGYPSLFQYCVRELGYSTDETYFRIGVARVGRRFPLMLEMIDRGELHLTGAARCAPQLTRENHRELLASVAHKSKRQIEEILAEYSPQEDLPDEIAPVDGTERVAVDPIAKDRFAVSFTASRRFCELIERAKELSSHKRPRPGLEELMEAALADYVEKLEKQKFKTTSRPQEPRAEESEDPRHIPAHVMREVYHRDGYRCTFVGKNGHRCEARWFLEFDHIDPVALGGKSIATNLRLRCFAHNQLTARRELDPEYASLIAAGFRPVKRLVPERVRYGSGRRTPQRLDAA